MKRRLSMLLLLSLFVLMLLFPKSVFNGASAGLLLWFHIVLPTLLPFIFISNLLIRTHTVSVLSRIIGPPLRCIFRVSGHGSFAILAGFLCGYPMGSKVISDLLKTGYISYDEARYLLSFCNNTSPVFVISYVVWQNLKDESLTAPALVILFLAPILCSFPFRRWYHPLPSTGKSIPPSPTPGSSEGNLIDGCMMDGFETITKVGGYIIAFSIVISLVSLLPVTHPLLAYVGLPSLEITNGIALIARTCTNRDICFVLALTLTSFGGWCAVAQTKCMLEGTSLPILPYIIEKLATAGVTSLLACGYVLLK